MIVGTRFSACPQYAHHLRCASALLQRSAAPGPRQLGRCRMQSSSGTPTAVRAASESVKQSCTCYARSSHLLHQARLFYSVACTCRPINAAGPAAPARSIKPSTLRANSNFKA